MRTLRLVLVAVLTATATSLAVTLPTGAAQAVGNGVVVVRTVRVGSPGNASVGVVPFTDAIYPSCAEAPSGGPECQEVGRVDHRFGIGRLEITVAQWVTFLNTVDPTGRNRLRLHHRAQSAVAWPQYGQVDRVRAAPDGEHYRVASRHWADKPFGFATFRSAARFVNALDNGRVRRATSRTRDGVRLVTYRVELSPRTRSGRYDLSGPGASRGSGAGFVLPSQDEWIKAAYFDPDGGGTLSYWKYPTHPGVFGDGNATAPAGTVLDYATGDVVGAGEGPRAVYHPTGEAAPTWCPPPAVSDDGCSSENPFGMDPTTYATAFVGGLATVGQAGTPSPWGTLDQGGNAVEWTDTITPPPDGEDGARTWRRMHGGVVNAPAYQMWPSAVGLQPENNAAISRTYPWLGFRIGVLGRPAPARRG